MVLPMRALGQLATIPNSLFTKIVFPLAVPYSTAIPVPPFADEVLPAAAFCTALESRTAPKAAKADSFAIHVNKTGRVCFRRAAAERLGGAPFCKLTMEGKLVRLEPTKKDADGALTVRKASGRPYISATKQFKPLGFDGSRTYDIEAKAYGKAGFEFRLL
jgi:hypothetical protein